MLIAITLFFAAAYALAAMLFIFFLSLSLDAATPLLLIFATRYFSRHYFHCFFLIAYAFAISAFTPLPAPF